ncbi:MULTISPECIES: hydantoinase/oxoprolinase family protein [Bosea]|uniref:hydantoinase/oxoprolinase family protein n=1 Tax=Bosea TaxID=85413 RepID=UPI00214F7ABB|nr:MULTISPECIES: hydantoinase/oxoprolinase family protein [Bosea]MCR4520703.1 hydantoinase/oxoprolinase family protein [Bosea sp. 47.2.35]MDR6828355.1 N-methylhydantoinase A [Bosea robiniae]MDR6895014.1 N-methylhydantoinase A [Bosea sp. BE109]MDR7138420.1 N-methylhydantoinase A [Bosea sp. BE168]MDR7175119.1 N-methylhydantoinase A [Bosea sp. BE271]
MAWRIGIDSGGTFTDVCLFEDATGMVAVWKVPSTPDDPSRAIARGTQEGVERVGASPGDIAYFGHGTTVGTNALIQHRGVKTGLITTEGFRDLIEIGRQKRPDLYDLQADKAPPLVTRDLRFGVAERVRHDGTVETPLDEDSVRQAARALKAEGVKAVAIGFLYGFVRPEHEEAAKRIVTEEFPEAFICASHEVAPEFREYERISTTVVNAYLGPVMQGYIRRLADRLKELGLKAVPHLTQSNGGVIGFDMAARLPVRTVLSGPSTGVVAAQAIGAMIGIPSLITFDMGGTSSDVALLDDGEAKLASEANVHGYPIKAPMLDIHTVGAGGGSLAAIDSGGLLKVGPRSAGADPGPVCYGRGATEPAVTDANVVLQTLNPTHLLGGRMPIDQSLSKQAIGRLAEELGLDLMATAQGIISVVTANMAKAIRVISVQRGHDPRDYALVAFGGAGPLHAARLARELDMKRIVVPRNPGIGCALGLLLTDLRANFATTRLATLSETLVPDMAEIFVALQEQADHWFAEEGVASADRRLKRTADLRYHGQNYELAIDVPDGPITPATITALAEGFAAAHKRLYGFVAEGEAVQLVTYRVEAVGLVPKAAFRPEPDAGPDASHAIIGSREVWFPEAGGFVACPIYDRDKLKSGNRFSGPAIVEQMDSTTVLLPGMTATVEPYLNLILEMP